jgi:formylglycine-generating enzyme required for sulfatase activity
VIVVKGLDTKIQVEAVVGPSRTGGLVYRAKDETSGTPIKVHELSPDRATPETIAQFLEEAKLLARVSEATFDVERLIAYGVAEDRLPFTAFEWLEGKSLAEELAARKGSPRSLDEAVAILEPAARALAAAHALGCAHGDVRPANLWLCEQGGQTRIKLTQFVLASRLGSKDGAFAPEYGAPEHFKASYGSIGPATDVYGLALCLVELVSGKRALEGSDDTELYLATSNLKKRPTLRGLGVQTGSAVEAVLARALAVDPKRRYQNARELWDALRDAIPERTPEPPSVRTPVVASAPRAQKPKRKSGGWLVLIGLAAAAAGVVAMRMPRTGPAPRPAITVPTAPPPPSSPPSASAATTASVSSDAVVVAPFLTDMIRIPAGTFTMGVDREGKGDGPAHSVRITKPFYIDRTEVTAEAYGWCIEEKQCTRGRVHAGDVDETVWGCNTAKEKPKHPINCVDRKQAEKYCAFAGKRLPTEAEWEYTARGSDRRTYPWGNSPPATCLFAVVSSIGGECGERKGTFEVGYAASGASPFAVLDLAGSVWEWVADGYEPYPSEEVVDPLVPLTPNRRAVMRGGSWDYSPLAAKTTYRMPFSATAGGQSTGFRCARDAE